MGCSPPAIHDMGRTTQHEVLASGRTRLPCGDSAPPCVGGGSVVKTELAPSELLVARLGQGKLNATAPLCSSQSSVNEAPIAHLGVTTARLLRRSEAPKMGRGSTWDRGGPIY